MRIALSDITSALTKVKSLVNIQNKKNNINIMLDIGDNIQVCYCDNKSAVTEVIDADINDNEKIGKIILSYETLMSIISMCQPSGMITVSDIELEVGSNNIINISAQKYMSYTRSAGEEEDGEEEKKVVSIIKQSINYYNPGDSIRYGTLSRMDYGSIFEGDNWDEWDKTELSGLLTRLKKEEASVKNKIYISKKLQAGFCSYREYLNWVPIDSAQDFGFSVESKFARVITEILSKVSDGAVYVCSDSRYCKIRNENNTVGIWFEMEAANNMDLVKFNLMQQKSFDDYVMIVDRFVMIDILKSATALDNNDNSTIAFSINDEDELVLNINKKANNGSKVSKFDIIADAYMDKHAGDEEDSLKISQATVNMSLANLLEAISRGSERFLKIGIAVEESGKFISITEIVDGTPNESKAIYYFTVQ